LKAEGVKGADGEGLKGASGEFLDAVFHFSGGFVREG
jgi:hypothetical protein